MAKSTLRRFPLTLKILSGYLSVTTLFLGADLTPLIRQAHALTCQEKYLQGINDPACTDAPPSGGPNTVSASGTASPAQMAVDQQNAVQEAESFNFSLKTQDGDILKYANSVLKEVERPDGTILENIALGADGSIQSADLKFLDGSLQVFQNGKVVGYTTPDGTQIQYENDLVKKTIAKDGTETLYSYTKNSAGKVTQTTLESSKAKTIYDANNRLKESFNKVTGVQNLYSNGTLSKIIKADGAQYIFYSSGVGTDTRIMLSSYVDSQGTSFSYWMGNIGGDRKSVV